MALQIIREYNSYDSDTLVETNEIACDSVLSDPEFFMFCVESELEDDETLDEVQNSFNS